jgi:hypothetical protein
LGSADNRFIGTTFIGTPHTTDSFPANLTFHTVRELPVLIELLTTPLIASSAFEGGPDMSAVEPLQRPMSGRPDFQ